MLEEIASFVLGGSDLRDLFFSFFVCFFGRLCSSKR